MSLKTVSIAMTAALSLSLASPTVVYAADDVSQALVSVCNYTSQNDKARIRKTLKNASLRLRDIYDAFECNGQSLLRFAMTKGSHDAGKFIAKKVSKDLLKKAEKDGKTVLEWAEANGHSDTPTVKAIQKRIN